ncbi:MAG: hypothetical protein NVV74_01095 [Magnetospirillum sp.]|nr:hypothetical protein [Magnetospirillum sp.]
MRTWIDHRLRTTSRCSPCREQHPASSPSRTWYWRCCGRPPRTWTAPRRSLDHLAHVVAHDLREPLRMMTAYAQLLARRYQDRLDTDADQFLAYLADGAQRMQTLTEDLLEYSNVARCALARHPCDSRATLDEALAVLAPLIAENAAVLHVGPMPEVIADAGQLTRLFANLVENALRYRHPQRPPEIHVSGAVVEGGWQFQVKDNGESIPRGKATASSWCSSACMAAKCREPAWACPSASASSNATAGASGWSRSRARGPPFTSPCCAWARVCPV